MKALALLVGVAVLVPTLGEASTISGTFNIIEDGTGIASYTSSVVTFDDANRQVASTGAFLPSNKTDLSVQPTTMSLVGVASTNTGANLSTATPDAISDFFTVGNYQFNLSALQQCGSACSATPTIYGFGNFSDTTGSLTSAPGEFTMTFSSLSTYSISVAALAAPVPRPSSAWLMLSSVIGLGAMCRRRRTLVR